MVLRLVGWSESQDSPTLVNVAALADQSVRVVGDDIVVPADAPNLIGYYALGPNVDRAQLVAPSLRRRYPVEISPVDIGAEPASPSYPVMFPESPIALDPSEALDAQAAESGVGATRATVLAWLSDGPIARYQGGEIFPIRATNASTLAANAWTNGALTLNDTLPAGRYAVVGMQAESAGLQAARLVFTEQGPRPGVIGRDAASDQGWLGFIDGRLGIWGEFQHDVPPTVDFLSNSADTSQVVILYLVKVEGMFTGPGRT